MTTLTRDNLRKEIAERILRPVYVLYGEETFLRDNAAKAITKAAFSEGEFRDFNDDQFTLSTPENIGVALAAANQLPMMASRRVIRITEVRVSTSSAKDTLKEDAEEELKAYLANPNPQAVLIFVADELNGSRRLGKLLKSQPAAIEFCYTDETETRKLAEGVFKKAGVAVEPNALRLLVELVGCDARRITAESEKLATAAMSNRTVETKLVESLVRNTRETSNFDFVRDLISGRKKEAVILLEKALSDGEEPLALLGLLAWQYRDALKKTSSRSAYADRLAHAIDRIAETDLAVKTSVGGSGKHARKQIEMLVCELASN